MEKKIDIVPCCAESQEFGPNDHSDDCPMRFYAHRFTVCVSVGGVVQFYQLTRPEIDDAWRTIQASALPEARLGFYDLRDGWQQMSTGAKIRDRANRNPEYKEFITSII